MAIEFQNATTAVTSGGATGNLTINVPGSTSDGDFLITGYCYEQATSPSNPTISGTWTTIATEDGLSLDPPNGRDIIIRAWYRRASSEPANYSITSNGSYGDAAAAFMLRYTGVLSSGDPLRDTATAEGLTSPQSGPSLTGLQSTDLSIQMAGSNLDNWDGDDITLSGPGGSWTQRANVPNNSSVSSTTIAVIDQFNQATGPSWTATSTESALSILTIGLALIEEPAEALLKSLIVNQQAIRRSSLW